ncbi:protein-L-isoaspartate(D-aspartate) O-methyltransferase [Algicola sagamiensis]|uniref:protein-L-isoaspartate(D-aspartate) O-methyltransferase n=1 Tax=Algicola sagamiensis TaxID=163869 RepID=UPI00037FCF4E|nr:protein-L-isoaspartate(D-aspartate) O-methyltransferase [Algicola sagamiensis]
MLSSYRRSAEQLIQRLATDGIRNEKVLTAMMRTPRHIFMDPILAHRAYENTALPIGLGQTISQPYIVAKMTELLLQKNVSKVLEIGTGSGYQAAILAQVVDELYSVERIKSLQWQAKRRLQKLDLHNVKMRHGDGWEGWPSKAPYDGIIVTAAAERLPEALLHQLKDGGVLICPVGQTEQYLIVIERQGDKYIESRHEAVRFVPLVPGEIE